MRSARALGLVLTLAALPACARMPPGALDERAMRGTTLPAGPFPKTYVNPVDRTSTLVASPRRIVSMSLGSDEMLVALVDPARLAGVTYLADDVGYSMVAGMVPPGVARIGEEPEAIVALAPDLVVAAGYTRADALLQLDAAGASVIRAVSPSGIDDVLSALTTLGRATGEEAKADALVGALRARCARVAERAARRRKLRAIVWDGGVAFTRGTPAGDLLMRAGAIDVAAEAGLTGAPSVGSEALLAMRPEVVIAGIDGDVVRRSDSWLLGGDALVAALPAARRGAVHGVPRKTLGSVSHHIVDALEAIDALFEEEAKQP
jgi:iron complex transport system substrate-binding protein